MLPLEITPAQTKSLLDRGEITLVDCREPEEHALTSIVGAVLIPLNELPRRIDELPLPSDRRLVVLCHHGMRSLHAVRWLRQQGFDDAQSLAGGIDAWAIEVEPGMARY